MLRTDITLEGLYVTETVLCRQMTHQVSLPLKDLGASVTSKWRFYCTVAMNSLLAFVTVLVSIGILWLKLQSSDVLSVRCVVVSVDCRLVAESHGAVLTRKAPRIYL